MKRILSAILAIICVATMGGSSLAAFACSSDDADEGPTSVTRGEFVEKLITETTEWALSQTLQSGGGVYYTQDDLDQFDKFRERFYDPEIAILDNKVLEYALDYGYVTEERYSDPVTREEAVVIADRFDQPRVLYRLQTIELDGVSDWAQGAMNYFLGLFLPEKSIYFSTQSYYDNAESLQPQAPLTEEETDLIIKQVQSDFSALIPQPRFQQ